MFSAASMSSVVFFFRLIVPQISVFVQGAEAFPGFYTKLKPE
jgi:hypothetical protein